MDSAHCHERNLAHSANGRNPPVKNAGSEILKLKEEHQKEIQKLTYESKIKLMESQMKIVNLTHQLEMLQLKNSYEVQASQVQADQLLQKEKDDLQTKLTAKEHEMTLYQLQSKKMNGN